LDNLSKGRIIAGFVRGIGSEYHSSGTNPYFSHEPFHEAHDLIIGPGPSPVLSRSTATTSACITLTSGPAISASAVAGLDTLSGVERDGRLGCSSRAQIPVPCHLLVDRPRGTLPQQLPRPRATIRLRSS